MHGGTRTSLGWLPLGPLGKPFAANFVACVQVSVRTHMHRSIDVRRSGSADPVATASRSCNRRIRPAVLRIMRAVASRVTTGEQGEPLKLAAVDTLSVLPHNLETKIDGEPCHLIFSIVSSIAPGCRTTQWPRSGHVSMSRVRLRHVPCRHVVCRARDMLFAT